MNLANHKAAISNLATLDQFIEQIADAWIIKDIDLIAANLLSCSNTTVYTLSFQDGKKKMNPLCYYQSIHTTFTFNITQLLG